MPVQRLVNLCPYPKHESRMSCPDKGPTLASDCMCVFQAPTTNACLNQNPTELFQHRVPASEIINKINERIKTQKLEEVIRNGNRRAKRKTPARLSRKNRK